MKKFLFLSSFLFVGVLLFINYQNHENVDIKEFDQEVDFSKLTGAEKFALYHSNIRKSPASSPFSYNSGYLVKEYNKLKKNQPTSTSRELTWEERGPGNVSGRTRTVWIDPRDDTGETWFVGSAQGGVWKTEDAGESYTLKTPDVPHLGTAAIMGCQDVPEVIYAGSGEGFNFLSAAGAGIFKSTDGGESWTVLASTTNNKAFANVLRMAVHPQNPDIVYAATRNNNSAGDVEGFVMRSQDGGDTWEEVLFHFDIIPDIALSPHDPNVLFAGLNQEGVLKTIDGGDNWDFVWLFESPELRPGRIELALSPSDPNIIYFTTPINDEEFQPGDKIFVSNDGGENFQLVIGNNGKDDYSNFSGGQSFWNKAITVDPFNPNRIYFAGQSAFLRMDVQILEGLVIGELDVIADGYNAYSDFFETSTKGVHVDHHGIYFSVVDEANQEVIMINTNDGGVAVSRDYGETFRQTGDTFLEGFNPEEGNWETIDGYNVSTFYGVDKMNGADRYVGGTQDNGSWISPEDPDASSRWSYAPSGDGFEAAWNYNDPNKVIESSQGNNFHRSLDGGQTWVSMETPGFGPFISAIANSKQDGDMIVISTNDGPAVSSDFGDTWTTGVVPDEYQFSFLRMPVDISLVDPNIVWTGVGMNFSNRICVSTDGGLSYTATSPYEEQELGEVAGIATHPADDATAYAVFGTAGQPKVVRTTDFGQTWEDISGFEGSTDGTSSRGFPDVAVFSLLVMPYDNNIIWAGTEVGIVESLDNGLTWNLIDDGLPATAIWEMKIINDEVVVATHGRGIWTTSLPELEGYEPPTPFIIASKFSGHIFDKKITGELQHLTPIDFGTMTIEVPTFNGTLTRTIEFGPIESPSSEEINIDLDDFDIGDNIYEYALTIAVERGNESRTRLKFGPFYDVDAEDPVEDYLDDFNDGNEDFAIVGLDAIPHFSVGTPNGFDNNGLESTHSFEPNVTYTTIFQKPIVIPASGSTLSFDEVAILQPAQDFGFGLFFSESMVLEATNNKGQSWIRLAEYSSEEHPEWEVVSASMDEPSSDLYRKRNIRLSDYFEEGDEVYFKIEMNTFGFPFTWGFILDNFSVSSTVSTEEVLVDNGITLKTYSNPFVTNTQVELSHENGVDIGKASLINLNGQMVDASIIERKQSNGTRYEIDGSKLNSGVYYFTVRIGNEVITEKLIKI